MLNAYGQAFTAASNAAGAPYQPYTGQIVAPLTSQQNQAINDSTSSASDWQPYNQQAETDYGQAQGYLQNATEPLYNTVQNYESPYTSSVVNATQQQFNNQNAIQQQGIVSNAAAQGAFGGDRSAVAQAITAGQQQANQAPVIAGLENTGYQTGLSADEAQSWLSSQAAAQEGNLGTQQGQLGATNFGVDQGTINQEEQMGAIGQAETQANLNVPYYQYEAGQAYPFQTSGFLANVAEGLGAGAGGTSSTTSPAASPLSQGLGLGIGATGLLGATGAFGSSGYLSGLFGSGAGSAGVLTGATAPGVIDDVAAEGATDFGGSALTDAAAAAVRRGGRIPQRAGGGIVSAPRFDTGGGITGFDALPYQQIPINGSLPQVGISIVPPTAPSRGGKGPPQPPQGIAPGGLPQGSINTSPTALFQLANSMGAFGKNGWATSNNSNTQSSRRGGIVHYDDGGNVDPAALVTGLAPPSGAGIAALPPVDASAPLSAASAPQIQVTSSDTPLPSGGGNGDTGVQTPQDVRRQVVDFWTGKGLPPAAAQGIANRVGAESGYDPTKWGDLNSKDGPSLGLYQHHADRLNTLLAQADPTDVDTQNNLAYHEVTGGDPVATAHFNQIVDAGKRGDTPMAAQLWDRYFERSANGPGAQRGIARSTAGSGSSSAPGIANNAGGDDSGMIVGARATPPSGNGIVPSATPDQTDSMQKLQQPGPNPWLALAAAGFGIASGRSPSAMQNIGAGALEGIKFLESERQAQPEMALKTAQASVAQSAANRQAAYTKAMSGGDLTPGISALEGNLTAAHSALSNSGETQSAPMAGSNGAITVAPLAAGAPPAAVVGGGGGSTSAPSALSPDQQRTEQALQGQIAQIRAQISKNEYQRQFSTPEEGTRINTNIASQQATIADLMTKLPSYVSGAAAARVGGENPGLIDRAVGIAAGEAPIKTQQEIDTARGKLPYTPGTARPGSYITMGGQPTIAVPEKQEVVDPTTGQRQQTFISPPLPGAAPNGAPGAAGIPNAPGGPRGAVAPGQSYVTGLGPSQQQELEGQGREANAEREKVLSDAAAAQNQSAILNNMSANAGKFWTGKFADVAGEANQYLRLINPAYNDTVASREQFVKDAGNLTRAATREVSSRAAYQEVQFIQNTLPNPEMSPQGIQRVIGELQGLNDYKIAKANALQTWMQSHNNLASGFETSWQANAPITPYTFIINRMDQPERQQLFAKWNQTSAGRAELMRLGSQVKLAQQSGWLQ